MDYTIAISVENYKVYQTKSEKLSGSETGFILSMFFNNLNN